MQDGIEQAKRALARGQSSLESGKALNSSVQAGFVQSIHNRVYDAKSLDEKHIFKHTKKIDFINSKVFTYKILD